jgi:protein SCO1/2
MLRSAGRHLRIASKERRSAGVKTGEWKKSTMPGFERPHAGPGLAAVSLCALLVCGAAQRAPDPFLSRVPVLGAGQSVPQTAFVDQRGRRVSLRDFGGGAIVVGFIYTGCTSECPLISQKFRILQQQLMPGPFHLVEISIDPLHDTPNAMAAYARRFGADARRWSMLTGQPDQIFAFERALGVSAIAGGRGEILHNNRTIVVAPGGKIFDIVDEANWSPADVAADTRRAANLTASPVARLDLALSKAVVAICGTSLAGRSGLGDLVAVVGVLSLFGFALYRAARMLFAAQA